MADTSVDEKPLCDPTSPSVNTFVDEETPEEKIYARSSSKFRWVVLALSCFAMFGTYFCNDLPPPLKAYMTGEKGIGETSFNMFFSLYSFPNMILPLLGGAVVDRLGANFCVWLFLLMNLVGHSVFAVAWTFADAAHGNDDPDANAAQWFWMMGLGRFMFGLGAESLVVAESTLLGAWFRGKEMALAMGANLSVARLGSVMAGVVAPMLYKATCDNWDSKGEAGRCLDHGGASIALPMWVGSALLAACVLMITLLNLLDRRRTKQLEKDGWTVPRLGSSERVDLRDIRLFPLMFWLLTASCVVVYAVVLPWQQNAQTFLVAHHGLPSDSAAIWMTLTFMISGFMSPFLGTFVDLFGRREVLLCISAVSLSTVHTVWATTTHEQWPHYYISLVVIGVSYCIYAAAIWPSVALLVDEAKLGTAYGFVTAVQNVGLTTMPLLVAQLVRTVGDGDEPLGHDDFINFEWLFAGIGYLGICIGGLLWFFDRRTGRKLARVYLNRRKASEADKADANDSAAEDVTATLYRTTDADQTLDQPLLQGDQSS